MKTGGSLNECPLNHLTIDQTSWSWFIYSSQRESAPFQHVLWISFNAFGSNTNGVDDKWTICFDYYAIYIAQAFDLIHIRAMHAHSITTMNQWKQIDKKRKRKREREWLTQNWNKLKKKTIFMLHYFLFNAIRYTECNVQCTRSNSDAWNSFQFSIEIECNAATLFCFLPSYVRSILHVRLFNCFRNALLL